MGRKNLVRRVRVTLVLAALVVSGTLLQSHAADWPQFRGPQRDGISEETGLPVIVAEDPLTCVARGGGMAMESMDRHTMDLLSTE